MRERRLSVRALWGLASWALPLGVVFVVTPPVLRALGSDRFGVLMIILLAPMLAVQLDLGIAASGTRRLAATLASGKVDAGRTLSTLAAALAVIGMALGASVWAVAPPLSRLVGFSEVLGREAGVDLIRWCAVWMAVSLITLMPAILARSAQALDWVTAVQTSSTALLWGVALVLVDSGRPLTDVVRVGIGLSVASALTLALVTRHLVEWRGPLRLDLTVLAEDRRFSAGMFVSQAGSALLFQGDRILIAAVGSPAVAGAYALCASVAGKTLAAVAALTSFAYAQAAGLHAAGERGRLEALVHALDRAVIVMVMPLLLPGWVLAGPFLALWLGELGTAEITTVFRILWVAFAIPAFAVPVGNTVAALGHSGLAARFSWLSAIVAAGSIVLLVPSGGSRGAAYAILLGMSTSLAFSLAARRTLGLPAAPGRARFWIGIACGLAAQLLLLVAVPGSVAGWPALLLSGAGAVAVFYLVRAVLGLLSPEEAQVLRRATGRFRAADPD